jgi:LPS-assembly protein
MLRRLFLVFLPALTSSAIFASEASWNCQQNKDSKEWVCVGEKKQTAKTIQPTPPVKTQPVRAATPDSSGTVEKTQAVKSQPIQAAEPINPESAERIKPVIAEPVQVTPPVTVKTAESIRPSTPAAIQINQPELPQQPVIAEPVNPPVTVETAETIRPKPASVGTELPELPDQPDASEPIKSAQAGLSPSQKPVVDNNEFSGMEANRPGWNCNANANTKTNAKDDGWNCQLVGADPKSKAKIAVAAAEPAMSLLTPAFNHQQEQIFSTLTSQLPYDPWANCNVERGTQQGYVPGPGANQRNTAPMDVKSNYAEVFDNEIGSYIGNVKMSRADQQASSNTANYDSVSEELELHGNVYYREEAMALHSDTVALNLASDQAKLRDAQFITPAIPLRGTAKAVYRDSSTFSRYKDVAYTSCRPGNQDWVIHASDLKMNKITGKGVTKNAWMEFKGTPVFYSPYLSFPIDNRRQSGFLSPSFGNTKYGGFRLAAPYYWNIAPNYDATFIPRELSKRGPLLATKFRYMFEQSRGNVALEFMPHDSVLGTSRYLGTIKNISQITPNITSMLDLNYVSDKTYFAELGNALSFANYNYLRSYGNVSYAREGISLTGLVDNYQSISTTVPNSALPYRRLPQINLYLNHAFQSMPLNVFIPSEYVYFQQAGHVNAQRVNTRPSISVPLETASSYFTPQLSLQQTNYSLNNGQPGAQTSISRTLPIFSADSGMNFERGFNIANTPYVHTLEPRLFYLYVPYTNQQNIPVYDSAQYDFQYYTMFRENQFSGSDRTQDANQITTALTSRLIDDKSGLERLKLSVGEIFYFRDRNVTLQYGPTPVLGSAVQTDKVSNVVAELSSELTHELSINTGLQWSPVRHDFERGKAALHYSNPANEIFNIGYMYRKNPLIPDRSNDIIQSDMSFRYPVYDNWAALGRWQYSLLYNRTQDAFMGIEKENCCWRFRIALRHYVNNISNLGTNLVVNNTSQVLTGTAQNGVFFEIELKGLSSLGDNMDYFLQQEIYGYRKSH